MVNARQAELYAAVAAMQKHKEAQQEGCVELNIGGCRFETSVQTLQRVPHTFFDAYSSGRYAQDVWNDGSIFVDRDGERLNSGTSSITCVTAMCRWRSPARVRACRCCVR
jgi:hypothetical protein